MMELDDEERQSPDEVVAVTWNHPVIDGETRLLGVPD